jgi:hypothetical protein
VIDHLTGLFLKSGRDGYVLVVLAAIHVRGSGKGKSRGKEKGKGQGKEKEKESGKSRTASRSGADEMSNGAVHGLKEEKDDEEDGKGEGEEKENENENVQRHLPGLGWIVWNWKRIPRGLRKGIKRLVSGFPARLRMEISWVVMF